MCVRILYIDYIDHSSSNKQAKKYIIDLLVKQIIVREFTAGLLPNLRSNRDAKSKPTVLPSIVQDGTRYPHPPRVIEKLVFIAPLRPGLNHRSSHNFVVSSPGTAHPIPSQPRTSCLIFRTYGVVYYTPVYFKYRYRGWRMKILPRLLPIAGRLDARRKLEKFLVSFD